MAQIQLPPELDKTSKYTYQIPRGQTVRVYGNALAVDSSGKCWIKGDWVVETSHSRFDGHKELEITRSKNGYIVKILPLWGEDLGHYTYPEWRREEFTVPKSIDVPVIAIIVVPKPHPRRSYYSELDAHYRNDPRYSLSPVPYK